MFQNMKVDIIYYKTNTDFEMEFNLCGCCRMRLLTDKTPDRKTMVHSLARAVSRSKIIIIVGSLFGDSGSITSVAEAISSKLTVTDNKTYGIRSEDEINIISGSTPLVTSDGIFGGCIIESGPQTMILLSDNKAVRKNIMQTLIFPYIEELYANELKEKAAQVNSNIADAIPDNSLDSEYVTHEADSEIDDDEQETEEELQSDYVTGEEEGNDQEDELVEEENSDFIIDSNSATDDEEDPILNEGHELLSDILEPDETEEISILTGMVFEPNNEENKSDKPYIEPDFPNIFIEQNNESNIPNISDFIEQDKLNEDYLSDDESTNSTKKPLSLNMPILFLTILLLLTIAILCYCIFFIPSQNGTTAATFIKETFNTLLG